MRATRASRGARPRSRSPRGCAASRRNRPSCGRRSTRPPSARSRSWRRSPPAPTAGRRSRPAYDNDLKARLEKLLADAALTERGPGDIFLQINRFLARRAGPRSRRTSSCASSRSRIPKNPGSALRGRARRVQRRRARRTARDNTALEEIDRALALKPGWERAALLKAEIVSREEARRGDRLPVAVRRRESRSARRPRARSRSSTSSRSATPRRARCSSACGTATAARASSSSASAVLSVQMKDWETAEALFQDLKRANYGDNGAVELYLAQIAEETGRYDDAIERYKAVPEGERAWLAKLRVAAMMAQAGQDGRGAQVPGRPARRHASSSASRCARPRRSCCATRTTSRARTRCSTQALEGASGLAGPPLRRRDGRREARPHRRRRGDACAAWSS